VGFSADSIECFPERIEATGNVKVSIPEISSEVSAGRVIMNLKSLAFDFDGDVKVERNMGGDSFPFLVKGNHVGWSLITGEMQTDVRHSAQNRTPEFQDFPYPNRTRGVFGGSSSRTGSGSAVHSGFVVPSGKRIGQVQPKRSAQTQGNSPQPKTQNRFGNARK
jgi:hypothetical protein